MSSHITSPFEIETNRLRGIVNECRSDLNQVMNELQMQQQKVETFDAQFQQEAFRKESENAGRLREAEQSQAKEAASRKAEHSRRIAAMREKLHVLDLQLATMGRAENFRMRRQALVTQLSHAGEDLTLLEQEIAKLASDMQKGGHTAELNMGRSVIRQQTAAVTMGRKGVKLGKIEETSQKRIRTRISDQFAEKLELALASEHAGRYPSIRRLAAEFRDAAEYERDMFAARNMPKLEKLLQQLEKQQAAVQDSQQSLALSRNKYLALCKLLEISPDEQLLSDPQAADQLGVCIRKLAHQYQKRKEHQYFSHAVQTVLARHNIEMTDAASDGDVMCFRYEHAQLAVSGAANGILDMQVTGIYEGTQKTMDDVRRGVSSARKICSLTSTIEQELAAEFGITFHYKRLEEPSEETMIFHAQNAAGGRRFTQTHQKADSAGG